MWKRLFKKSDPSPDPPAAAVTAPVTLKQRVAAFWEWYGSVAERFYEEIENKRCGELQPEVSAKVDVLLPDMGWVFGPGEGGEGHSFTLTPEGNAHKRLVAQYWLRCAPQLPGWTFYGSRQPSELHRGGHSIRIDGKEFGAHEIWLTPQVDADREVVDLMVWHPLFEQIEERLRWTVTFLWLDEALGEDGVSQRIGEIKLGDEKLAGAIPLSELPEFISELERDREWRRIPPHARYFSYQRKNPARGAGLREDILTGTTRHLKLIQDFPMETNPLGKIGVEYVMVAIPMSLLPDGEQVAARGEVEDALEAALGRERSGEVLGGATGLENAYIDLVLYDAGRSRSLVKSVLAATPYAGDYTIANFTMPSR